MASSLLHLTRSVLTFRPAAAIALSAHPLLSIHGGRPVSSPSENMTQRKPFNDFNQQCYTTTPTSTVPLFDKTWLKRQMADKPGIHPVLFTRVEGKLVMKIPGLENTESAEGLHVSLRMPGIEAEDVDACIDGKHLLIQAKKDEKLHLAGMELPVNFNQNSDLIAVMKDGVFKLTIPMLESQELMMDNSHRVVFRLEDAVICYDKQFGDRSTLRPFFPATAHPGDPCGCKSFTMYKKVNAESLCIKLCYGVVKMESTSEGLCLSLKMPGFKIEDVKSTFEDDTFLIEGKRGMEHYIGGVRVPKGYEMKDGMIKTEMHEGTFKVTLPHVINVDSFFITN